MTWTGIKTTLAVVFLGGIVWAWNGGSFAPLGLAVVAFVVWALIFAER